MDCLRLPAQDGADGMKYTVRSRSAEENGVTRVVVSVSDTGIGIGPDRLQSVFEAFAQGGRQITRQFGGLGLGLAISQAIARSHLGTLSVASDGPGCGATFTLSLPFSRHLIKPVDIALVRAAISELAQSPMQ